MPDERRHGPSLAARIAHRIRVLPIALEAGFELALASALTRFPERWYFRRYGLNPTHAPAVPLSAARPPPGSAAARAARAGHVVRRVADMLPVRAVCLQQSLATRRMLLRRGMSPVMVFGIRRKVSDGGESVEREAHAWIEVEGIVANGYRSDLVAFDQVGRFA